MSDKESSSHVKPIPNSTDAYALLKPITDAAQAGTLKPWSKPIVDLLASYGVNIQRRKDYTVQATLSFPETPTNRSMAIGIRYVKADGSFAEDLFVFEENVGLTCYYRGTQERELPEYDDTHHRKLELTEFLPDVQQDMAELRRQVEEATASSGVELITDEMHLQAMQAVADEFNEQVRSFAAVHGNSPSAVQQYSRAVQIEATKQRRALQAKKVLSDRVYQTTPPPEIALIISAQANNNRFDVRLVNNSGQSLVAERLAINSVETPLEQQFSRLYILEQVNYPEGIFDNMVGDIKVSLRYRTLDNKHFELTMVGEQEHRMGDGRYNIIFPRPSSIKAL